MDARDDDQQAIFTDSVKRDQERERLAKATEAFLAEGGKVEQVGFKMKNAPESFVISARKTPVYAHLFQAPEPAKAEAEPVAVPTEAPVEPTAARVVGTLEVPPSLSTPPTKASKADPRRVMRQLRKDTERLMARIEQMRTH